MTIRTSTQYAPVAFGTYNWAAWDDSKDFHKADAVGFGMTEAQAIERLIHHLTVASHGS